MIPKIIHYCWFGKGKMSALERKCMESWKNQCPDFKIKEWNESNFDINYCPFTQEAYQLGKYAFVSDVGRLYALEKEGGVYLDTDMFLVQSLSSVLDADIFVGEYESNKLGVGIMGASLNHSFLKLALSKYEGFSFNVVKPVLIPDLFDHLVKENEVKLTCYPPEVFYPLPFEKREEDFSSYITNNTMAVHLWNHSWKSEISYLKEFRFLRAIQLYLGYRIKGAYSEETDFWKKFLYYLKVYIYKTFISG